MQDELNNLTSEINRIGNTTEFNTQKLLNGGVAGQDGTKLTEATSATKTLSGFLGGATVGAKTFGAAMTAGTVANSAATTGTMVSAAGTVGAGTIITVNGIEFDASGQTLAGTAADKATLEGLTGTDGNGQTVTLGSMATVTAGAATIVIATNDTGALNTIEVSADSASILNNNSAEAEDRGAGTALVVNGKTFDLSGQTMVAPTGTGAATNIETLGNIVAEDGVTKLSDLVDITANGNDELVFTNKSAGSANDIKILSDTADAFLGTTAPDFAPATNTTAGNDGTGTLAAGTKVMVDNTTFDLSGVTLDSADSAASIEALKNVTSGGVKLGDLLDITDDGGKLTFTSKSEGATSTIQFTGADAALGSVAGDVGATNAVKGTSTTVERAGIEASGSLDTADITIANDSSFKISVGTDSAVNVTLKGGKTYDTNNTDTNVAKAAMQDLVKDLNAALQDAGLDSKVSASLSQDNKVQFISESGKDLALTEGTNNPLAALGVNVANDKIGNVDQVVGAGVQGSGYTTKFQIGANTGQSMSLTINDMRSSAIGITGNAGQAGFTKSNSVTNGTNDIQAEAGLNISNKEDASKSIDVIDKAIAVVSSERGKLGAVQNRLEHTINNLNTSSENLTAAESRIRDVDYALAA